MSAHSLHQVEVVIDVVWLGSELRMCVLHRQSSRTGDVYSFEFDEQWLARKDSVVLGELSHGEVAGSIGAEDGRGDVVLISEWRMQ